jgi:ABC-2 type transport system permease protein/lipopolysaccharide transport system permease protein
VFRRRVRLGRSLRELVHFRELIGTLAMRDIKSRYKQAVLGIGWAVVTPVLLMVVFTIFFKRVARVDTGAAPYALFSYLGLLPWTFFNSSVSTGGQSLVSNSALLNKVYSPREVFPIASVTVAGLDLAISTLVLGVLFVVYGYAPHATSVWVPLLFLVQLMFTLGLTFALSGLLVYVRDLRQAIPIVLQLGLFATPVAYGVDKIPESWQVAYAAVNPLVPVIDGLRRTVLYGQAPRMDLLLAGGATAFVVLVIGYLLLKRLETGFADVA